LPTRDEYPVAGVRDGSHPAGRLHEHTRFDFRIPPSLPRTLCSFEETLAETALFGAGRTENGGAQMVSVSPAARRERGRSAAVAGGGCRGPTPGHVRRIIFKLSALPQHHVPCSLACHPRNRWHANGGGYAKPARTSRRAVGVRRAARCPENALGLGHVEIHFARLLPEPLYPVGHRRMSREEFQESASPEGVDNPQGGSGR